MEQRETLNEPTTAERNGDTAVTPAATIEHIVCLN